MENSSTVESLYGFDALWDQQIDTKSAAVISLTDWPAPLDLSTSSPIRPVPLRFLDARTYQKAICPLTVEEAREGARQSFPPSGTAPLKLRYIGHLEGAIPKELGSAGRRLAGSRNNNGAPDLVRIRFVYSKQEQYKWEDQLRSEGALEAHSGWSAEPIGRSLVMLSLDHQLFATSGSFTTKTSLRKRKLTAAGNDSTSDANCIVALCISSYGNKDGSQFEFQVHRRHAAKLISALEQQDTLSRRDKDRAGEQNRAPKRRRADSAAGDGSDIDVEIIDVKPGTTVATGTAAQLSSLPHQQRRAAASSAAAAASAGADVEDMSSDDDEEFDDDYAAPIRRAGQLAAAGAGASAAFGHGGDVDGAGDVFSHDSGATIPSYWYCWCLGNAVTSLRELEALAGINTLNPRILSTILDPAKYAPNHGATLNEAVAAGSSAGTVATSRTASGHTSATPNTSRQRYLSPEYTKYYLQKEFNASQLEAIDAALSAGGGMGQLGGGDAQSVASSSSSSSVNAAGCGTNGHRSSGFTLIQGPPGTGKTTTILGLINSIHLSAYSYYYETLLGRLKSEEPPKRPSSIAAAEQRTAFAASSGAVRVANSVSSQHAIKAEDPRSIDLTDDGAPVPTTAASVSGIGAAPRDPRLISIKPDVNPGSATGSAAGSSSRPATPVRPDNASSSSASTAVSRPSAAAPVSAVPGVVTAVPLPSKPAGGAGTGLRSMLQAAKKDLPAAAASAAAGGDPKSAMAPSGVETYSAGARFRGGDSSHAHGSAADLRAVVAGSLRYLVTSSMPTETCLDQVQRAMALKPRILVTAPSNTAIDGICMRIVRERLRSGTSAPPAQATGPGQQQQHQPQVQRPELSRYMPPIRRVGEAASTEVRNAPNGVFLEAEVDRLLAMGDDPATLKAWGDKLMNDRMQILHDIERQRIRVQHDPAWLEWKREVAMRAQAGSAASGAASGDGDGGYLPSMQDPTPRLVAGVSSQLTRAVEAFESNRLKLERLRLLNSLKAVHQRDLNAQRNEVRRGLRNSLLDESQIVLTTTSSAALNTLESFVQDTGRPFDICIIDEAAQAVEPSTLIPLRYGAAQVVLVGDPQQLPATVISRHAARAGYDRSMFARMAEAGHPVHMLRVQYRCHPMISAFPSHYFYGGRLIDGENVQGTGRINPLHDTACFKPLLLYDFRGGHMSGGGGAGSGNGTFGGGQRYKGSGAGGLGGLAAISNGAASSYSNAGEAAFVLNLLHALHNWRGADAATGQKIKFTGSVGIITFYRNQLQLLKNMVSQSFDWQPGTVPVKGSSGAPAAPSGGGAGAGGQAGDAAGSSGGAPERPKLRFSLDINTVDGFQGQERDVIILSCVRTVAVTTAELTSSSTEASAALDNQGSSSTSANSGVDGDTDVPVYDPRNPPVQPDAEVEDGQVDDEEHAVPIHVSEMTADDVASASGAAAGGGDAADIATGATGVTSSSLSAPSGHQQQLITTRSKSSAVGFLDDPRRINVALTRARYACCVVGQVPALRTSDHWAAFVKHCEDAGCVIRIEGGALAGQDLTGKQLLQM